MVSSKCFVPGCKTGYESDKKKRKAEGKEKLSLFSAPPEMDQLQKWKKAIPRSDKELTLKDKVCELHFLPEEISRYFIHHMPDGATVLIPKDKISLVKDAVPSVFPNLPSYLTKNDKKRKPPVERMSLSKNDKKRKPPVERMSLSKNNKRKSLLKRIPLSKNDKKRKLSLERILLSKKIKTKNVQMEEVFSLQEAVSTFTFNDLLENLSKVRKPNKLWSITSHENFIICVKWDTNYAPERQIIIDTNLRVKFKYCGMAASVMSNTFVESVENLSQIIAKTDKCEICPGAINGNKNCSIYMERQWGYGRPKVWCMGCRTNISRTHRGLISRLKKFKKLHW